MMYSFHAANIHEARFAARVARATPLLLFVINFALTVHFLLWDREMLILLAGFLTTCVCLWTLRLSAYSAKGIVMGSESLFWSWRKQQSHAYGSDDVAHVVVIPNYKEDVELLSQTLQSLSEAKDSGNLFVVLAMEDREGLSGVEKANKLKEHFEGKFAEILIVMHPQGLQQEHNDGTVSPELPGKASNLRWAVRTAHVDLAMREAINMEFAVLTVADADCIFHPSYFSEVSKSFLTLRRSNEHLTSMWQAPQLPFRNYFESPAPSRVWGYLAAVFDFGSVSSLSSGGQHMLFSAYSVALQTAVDSDLWDGDVITEDHHAYLKGFFYSIRARAMVRMEQKIKQASSHGPNAATSVKPLQIHPIMFPIKSTSVASDEGTLTSWYQRWQQAKRHAQGVAELSYAVLATFDMFCTLPARAIDLEIIFSLFKVMARLLCVHILPPCQMVAATALSIQYFFFEPKIQQCNIVSLLGMINALWAMEIESVSCILLRRVLAFCFALPLATYVTLAFTSYLLLSINFLGRHDSSNGQKQPLNKESIWSSERGGVKPLLGSRHLSMGLLVVADCTFFAWPTMAIYGGIPTIMAIFRVCFMGNEFEYVTAAKTAPPRSASRLGNVLEGSQQKETYGTLHPSEADERGLNHISGSSLLKAAS